MKRFLFFMNVLCICAVGKAQTNIYHPIPDSGAVWSEHFYTNSSTGYYLNAVGGDTVINAETWHKVYTHNPNPGWPYDTLVTPSNSTLVGAIREDASKKVFLYAFSSYTSGMQQDSVYLLYDFSKNVGDTIFFQSSFPYAPYACQYVVVYAIDSVIVNQQYRKRFDIGDNNNGVYDKWIEGVGSQYDLLSSVMPRPVCTCVHEMICYNYRGAHYYLNPAFLGCYPYTGLNVTGYDPREDIALYPLPANEFATVSLNNSDDHELKIYDLDGKCLLEQAGRGEVRIKTSVLPAGVYHLAISQSSRCVNKKLVVTH